MRDHVRVLVIGGGAMGASLLYHLAKLGWSETALVEKNELTAGSTWHAAGLCTHFAHNLTIMQMRAHSVRLYSGILERETGQPVSFHSCGALRITRSAERMAEFRQVRGLGRFAGQDFHILTPAELKEIYPLVELDGLCGAIFEPLDGYVDPSQATHAMAKGARDLGAKVYRHNPVLGMEQQGDGSWLVQTQEGDIRAEIIVNAAGTWCREIGGMMGCDLPVVPMLHQYLVTDRVELLAALDKELPIIRDPEESWYLRPERDGYICGPYEKGGTPWGIDGIPPDFGMELLPPNLDPLEDIVAAAMERVPALAEAGIKTVVNGPITFTPDANPLIGPAYDLRNAWLLTGSSMGVMEGGGAGRFLAEWIVGGEPPMDPLPVHPQRFGAFADRSYRIAKAVECFGNQFAVHFPYEERAAGRPGRKTPLYEEMKTRGARFGFVYGWERPNYFGPVGDSTEEPLTFGKPAWHDAVARECETLSQRAGLADLSAFAKFEVTGPQAEAFLDNFGANRPPANDGAIGLLHVLAPNGGILSEFTVTRLKETHYYLVGAAAARRQDFDLLRSCARDTGLPDLEIADATESRGVTALMGPISRDILQPLADTDLGTEAFPWLSAREITLAGLPCLALRVSYVGELGWELHHALDDQKPLFEAIAQSGSYHNMGFFGTFAMNACRLEKGYRAWGADLTTERTPLEAGLAPFVRTENRDFIGRDALLARSKRPDHWSMELLEIEPHSDTGNSATPYPFGSHRVDQEGRAIGMVTSAAHGHRTGKILALAYLRENPDAQAPLSVDILGQSYAAQVLKEIPYDPANARMRG